MIKSMTGYGRAQKLVNGMSITVELKSVNHRYFEFTPKVYRGYAFLEDKLKTFLQPLISRGKVECYVLIESIEADDSIVQVNYSLASAYVEAFKALSEKLEIENNTTVSDLAEKNDIFSVRKAPADEELIWNSVSEVLSEAVQAFITMRRFEGNKLREDILSRVEKILSIVQEVEISSPKTVRDYYDKLLARINEVLGDVDIDPQRVLTEAAIFADKTAINEETVRLRSHIIQLKELMTCNEPIGRKLDFLVQEINREVNTIGSKGQNVDIAKNVIEIKAEIEKIREQVQNIE